MYSVSAAFLRVRKINLEMKRINIKHVAYKTYQASKTINKTIITALSFDSKRHNQY